MKKSSSIVFTGDIGFDKYMDHRWEDDDLLAPDIISFMHDSDHVIVDVEGPISAYTQEGDASGMRQFIHAINPAAIRVLEHIHADIWDINNNHMLDIGDKGLLDTMKYAKAGGFKTIGAGKNIAEAAQPIILDEAGGIGIFAVGYRADKHGCFGAGEHECGCLLWDETDIIRKNIDTIKSTCRWCIIVCHGGEEFTSLPSPYVRQRYLSFLEMGADFVVSHHPHVPMNYETFSQKAIFYSLGNFIFDTDYQRTQKYTDTGVILKLKLTEDDYSFEAIGSHVERGPQRIVKCPLPKIFTEVPKDEYEMLYPLAAQRFVECTKRQFKYLFPDQFSNASEEDWEDHFTDPNRPERIPGEILDFTIIYPIAQKEKEGTWKNSSLENVKQYILSL